MAETKIVAEPGRQDIVMTREFEAPRELVFRAHTDPDLYIKWLGQRGSTITLETFEPKDGGSWRYTYRNPSGDEYLFRGVFHEVTRPSRITQTFEFLSKAGFVTLETATFEELPNGRTRLTAQSVFQSVAQRDGELRIMQGMDPYDRLAELLDGFRGK